MKKIVLLCSFVSASVVYSQVNIIPQPVEIKMKEGNFTLEKQIQVVSDKACENSARFLGDYLNKFYKIKPRLSDASGYPKKKKNIFLLKGEVKQPESYTLDIKENSITISGDEAGIFRGVQTLIQLLPVPDPNTAKSKNKLSILQLTVSDYPRFTYRGLHLDCGRHFMPVDFIKKYIDYIALHKMNYFHWHLTEDQGWRIEIKKYPKLTEVGAWRNGTILGRHPGMGNDNKRNGGYYTQEQVKEVVKYAADRYITVVPEIEMPGHSSAAIAAYPSLSCFSEEPTKNYFPKTGKWAGDSTGKQVQQAWSIYSDVFCAGKEETFQFLQDVIEEILPLFPGKYIHVGGDECPKANWKRCPNCQKRMKDHNLKDEHELQSYFIQRMENYINGKGKTLIGWDEILEGGLAPNAVVMSWRGEQGGIEAAKQNHEVVMTPTSYVYFDYAQSENEDSLVIGGYLPLEKVYSYEPIPAALNNEQGKYVLGAQANVWTEYMNNPRKVEYMIFPRLTALSEVLWSQKEKKNWDDFEKRLQVQFKRYDLWKANYSKAYYDLKSSVLPAPDNNGVLWKLESKIKTAVIKFKPGSASGEIIYTEPIKLETTNSYNAKLYSDNKDLGSVTQQFHFNKATGKNITLITSPAAAYKSDGAFTLVNGIWNEKGLAKAKEFLGFSGTDCEAVIDLGKDENFSEVIVHAYRNEGSWIYRPLTVEVQLSADGKNFSSIGLTDDFTETKNGNCIMKVELITADPVRYVKVIVKNWGDIPANKPGAGNQAWLFVDEIEINPPSP